MALIPKPEFPRPDRARARFLNLNGEWAFMLFPAGEEAAEEAFRMDRVGYDRRITVPFSWTCPLSGVNEDVAGIGWYRREARFEAQERVFLCFGAADYLCDAYVNGAHVLTHEGGYTYFEKEITDKWHTGSNTIEIRCEDYRRENQLYGKQGYGEIQGIWQTVWLEARPQNYIDRFRFVTRMDGEIALTADVCAPDGETLCARFDGQTWETRVSGGVAALSFQLSSPRLWSPDDPYLYEGELTLGGDTVKTYFGVREIGTVQIEGREDRWITLNGKPLYLNGTLDQAFNPQGYFTYPSEAELRAEAWRLKRLGLNMVRIHIKCEEPRKLYWMDKMGVLVMADVPCFWGEPDETAKAAYDKQWPDMLARDYNHPSIFAWVMFNETWGLLSGRDPERVYRPETQEWVRDVYRRAKRADPTRFVEDNSACRYDHVESDLNTWHFYINGYEAVRDHIGKVVLNTRPGSEFNYIGGNQQCGMPLMNSECGMVWGVDGSAGDSDIAWQYHYMLNEFRLHDKVCGFVFTEFHDVINEFNGYYRIDDQDKDFGYQDFCWGMRISDLHAADFVAVNAPPCQIIASGASATVPLVLSSFSDRHHADGLTLKWALWHDGIDGCAVVDTGARALPRLRYGANDIGDITVCMPAEDAVAVLSLYLCDLSGGVVSRNFITFDVRAPQEPGRICVPVADGVASGFAPVWRAHNGEKLCMGGAGKVKYQFALPKDARVNDMTLYFEAGSKRVLAKDLKRLGEPPRDMNFMRGYRVDRGGFDNSYFMTDEDKKTSELSVLIDGNPVASALIADDFADSRGVLSWHNQPSIRLLDEAGSYGQRVRVPIPSRMIPGIVEKGGFTLTIECKNDGGLALYGRHSGRYAHGMMLVME